VADPVWAEFERPARVRLTLTTGAALHLYDVLVGLRSGAVPALGAGDAEPEALEELRRALPHDLMLQVAEEAEP
jgi:hypothetical protein